MTTIDLDTVRLSTRVVEERGIVLPWERWSWPPVYKDGKNLTPERPDPPELIESGEVFITLNDLYQLAEQDVWDSQFGTVLLLGTHEGYALEQAGLAVQETKGGYHRSEALQAFLDRLENETTSTTEETE